MNTQNYASLEACQRLVDAGIVLETESCWRYGLDDKWSLVSVDWATTMMSNTLKVIPAPSMAEAWRELPEWTECKKQAVETKCVVMTKDNIKVFFSINPTDALIDLLIWLKQQNRERIVNKLIDRAEKLKW